MTEISQPWYDLLMFPAPKATDPRIEVGHRDFDTPYTLILRDGQRMPFHFFCVAASGFYLWAR